MTLCAEHRACADTPPSTHSPPERVLTYSSSAPEACGVPEVALAWQSVPAYRENPQRVASLNRHLCVADHWTRQLLRTLVGLMEKHTVAYRISVFLVFLGIGLGNTTSGGTISCKGAKTKRSPPVLTLRTHVGGTGGTDGVMQWVRTRLL